MSDDIEEIQRAYIAELRALAPELRRWWEEGVAREGEEAFHLRWATRLAGHPRFIEVFRRHYLWIDRLNAELEGRARDELPPEEARWGIDDLGPEHPLHIPREILLDDIETVAPDVADLVEGLFFVPVGVDAEGRLV